MADMKGRRIQECRQNVSRTFLRPKKCQVDPIYVHELPSWEEEHIIPSLLLLPPSLVVLFNITNAAYEPFNPTCSTLSPSRAFLELSKSNLKKLISFFLS